MRCSGLRNVEQVQMVLSECYAITTSRIKGKQAYAHQLLMKDVAHAPEQKEVDHRNRNRLDNRKSSNLRWVTRHENMRNMSMSSANTSGVTGVYKTTNGTWKAFIGVDDRTVHLGEFNTKEEATAARLDGEEQYWRQGIPPPVAKPQKKAKTPGVFQMLNKKWRVQINVNRRKIELGTFETEDEAVDARKDGELKYRVQGREPPPIKHRSKRRKLND